MSISLFLFSFPHPYNFHLTYPSNRRETKTNDQQIKLHSGSVLPSISSISLVEINEMNGATHFIARFIVNAHTNVQWSCFIGSSLHIEIYLMEGQPQQWPKNEQWYIICSCIRLFNGCFKHFRNAKLVKLCQTHVYKTTCV